MNPFTPLWFLFLAVMGYAFQRETKWISRFSVFTVFILTLYIRYGIAVPFSTTVNALSTRIPLTRDQLIEYYVAAALAWIVVFIAVWAAQRLLRRPAIEAAITRRLAARQGTARTWPLVGITAAIIAVVVLVWIVIPWREFIQGFLSLGHSAAGYSLHRARYGVVTGFAVSGLNYAGSFARFALAPAALWILFLHRSRSRAAYAMFAVVLAALLAIGLSSGQKQPNLLLALGFVFALLIVNGTPSLFTWRVGALALVLFFIVLPFLYHLQYPGQNYLLLLWEGIFRTTIEYSRSAQLRFAFYPDRHPFLLGLGSFALRSGLHLLGVRTGDAESPETYIPHHSPGNVNYPGTWNAGYFAEGWADFGWFGVIITSILVGLILVAIETWYRKGPVGPLQMGTYAAICVATLYLTDVALTTAVWTFGVLTSFAVYAALRLFPDQQPPPSSRRRRWSNLVGRGNGKTLPVPAIRPDRTDRVR